MLATTYLSRTDDEPAPVPRSEPVVWGDLQGPMSQVEMRSYEERGFHTDRALITETELHSLEAEVSRLTDPAVAGGDHRVIYEKDSDTVRSIFQVHELSERIRDLVADERLAGRARQILGSDVYVHQSRINCKPGLRGREFYWHSDFETWHHEDGMPQMRAVSIALSLTDNTANNGSLMLVPGSHKTFVGCVGRTPQNHHEQSLRQQQYGVPSDEQITSLVAAHGIETVTGPAGSAVMFDSNCMHGSNGNITPFPRRNIFVVYNSVDNMLVDPLGGTEPRPEHIAARDSAKAL